MRYYFSQLIILLLFVSFLLVPKITYSQTATCECNIEVGSDDCLLMGKSSIDTDVTISNLRTYKTYLKFTNKKNPPSTVCGTTGSNLWNAAMNYLDQNSFDTPEGYTLNSKHTIKMDDLLGSCNFTLDSADGIPPVDFFPPNSKYKISCSDVNSEVEISKIVCKNFDNNQTECQKTENNNACFWIKDKKSCINKDDSDACKNVKKEDDCKNQMTACTFENNTCKPKAPVAGSGDSGSGDYAKSLDAHIADQYGEPEGYEGPLPTCAFTGSCRDVNDLVEMVIKIVEVIFGFIAGLAFVFFVYGGFTMMLSFGSSEKVKKGQQVLVAAVVGLIIVFSAYILIDFLLDALGVVEGFRGIDLK